MGFLSPYAATARVDLGEDDQGNKFWAELRVYLSTDDATAAQKAMLNVTVKQSEGAQPEVATEFDQGSYLKELVTRALISWNLTDANDILLPASTVDQKRASVAQLPFWAVKEMASVIKDEKRSGKEAEDFPAQPSSGDQAE